jgi:RHS repeat-associated protein
VSALRVTLVDADQGLVRTRVSDALGTASAWADANGSVRRSADALGNASTAAYDAAGSLLLSLDAEGRASTRTLDLLGRVLSSSDALGNTSSATYDARGRTTTSTGPAGDLTAFAYDADGRTLSSSVTRSADGRVRTERTAYDARGFSTSTTDGEGRATTYGYSAAGRPVLRTRPDGASASSTVDLLGRVTAVVHEDGTTSAYAYDMLSHVVSRSGAGLAESWSYDASGRPAAAARGGVALAGAYDAVGRVSTETRDGRPVAASRDADGRLASFSAPGIAQSLAYDAAGRLTTVAVPGQADAYVSYDRSGLESWRLARAGGSDVLRTDLHRDAAGRPLEVAATSSSGAQAGLLRTLDPEGAPLTQVDQSGKGWSFSRDLGTRELLGAQEIGGGSASVATGYDLAGLRTTHSDLLASGAWSTNAAGEVNQARGRPVVNDLLGRVTSLDGWNHTYSCDGLLLSSEPASPSEGSRRSVHAYDALGRRVRTMVEAYVGGQWVAFSTTERDFLGRLPLGIETSFADGSAKSWRFMRGPDASGTLEGAGGARGVLAVLKDASSWKAVAADTLGNVLALAGTSGDFTRRTFDPWGNPLTRDAAGNLRASTLSERRADYDALPLAWASQEVDPDTGLTHYHFREYSPSLGGWLTRDPIGLAGGYLNLRSYLGNRPADQLDVWGEVGNWFTMDGGTHSIAEMVAEAESRKQREIENLERRKADIIEKLQSPCADGKNKSDLEDELSDIEDELYSHTGMGQFREFASMAVGAIPLVSEVQSGLEVLTGRDYVAGRRASRLASGVGLVAGILPFGKTATNAILKQEAKGLAKSKVKSGVKAGAEGASLLRKEAMDRGRASEARVLKEMGLEKNTKVVTACEGKAIPDAITDTMFVEIKDVKRVTATEQIRIQTEAARAAGRESVLVTGAKTKVSKQAEEAFDVIIRDPNLGPK